MVRDVVLSTPRGEPFMSVIEQIPMLAPVEPVIAPKPVKPKTETLLWWPSRTDRWTLWHAVAAGIMAFMAILATWDAWEDIYVWARTDEENSHLFLVPIVAACMMWVRRHRFRYCKPTGTGLGFLITVAGWAVTTFGFYTGIQSLWHGGAVLVVIGCAMSVLGKHCCFGFFPPLPC